MAFISLPARNALRPFFVRSLRGRLVLLVAAVLVPGTLLSAWLIGRAYAHAQDAIERNLRESVRALSLLTDALMREHEAQLEGIAATIDVDSESHIALAEELHAIPSTADTWLVLTDEHGRQIVNTSQSPGSALPRATPDDALMAALRNGRTHVSDLQVSPATSRPVVRITVPVGRRAGAPWMLSCVLSTDAVAASLMDQQIGVGWLISVVDRSGRIIGRSRDPARFVGASASPAMVERSRTSESGILQTVTLDGVKSHTAFHRSPRTGWTVILAAPRADLMRGPNQLALVAGVVSLTCGLGALVLAATGGRAVIRAVRRLVEQTQELACGVAPMRSTGIIETDHVSQAIAAASHKLAAREVELARARDEAIDASRAKDAFLATLSHELRTPLNPVLLVASDAATDESIAPDVRELFAAIEKNVRLEARLIDDLLDITRIGRGKLTLNKHAVDIHAVLQDAIDTVAGLAREKHIALSCQLTAEQGEVHGDPVRLQQVFWNLLTNAVKFTPEGGRVEVRTTVAGGNAKLTFSDTGIGLTSDELCRIFDAFVQGDHSGGNGREHRSLGGLGLGLAISRMLVGMHGGTIEATSPGRHQGSTFTVTLPLHRPLEPACADRHVTGVSVN